LTSIAVDMRDRDGCIDKMNNQHNHDVRPLRRDNYEVILAVVLATLVFSLGGASRVDDGVLSVLRPAIIVFGGIVMLIIPSSELRTLRAPLIWLGLLMSWILIQLVPLPASVWAALPGRSGIADLQSAAGHGAIARPINLWPDGGWNAFFACFVPAAAILVFGPLKTSGRVIILTVIATIGIVSGVLGLLQILGPAGGPLYFYEVTNAGQAVGLFANRNHQAVFLAITLPTLAAVHRLARPHAFPQRIWTAVIAMIGFFIIPLIIITGSRSGFVQMILSIVLIPAVLGPRIQRISTERDFIFGRNKIAVSAIVLASVVLMIATSYFTLRITSIERMRTLDPTGELRLSALPTISHMVAIYFPVGCGFGSFAEAYRVFEPGSLAYGGYLNQAHNDLWQFVLEGGLIAAVLLLAGFWMIGNRFMAALRRRNEASPQSVLMRWSLAVICIMLLASGVDYPLRTPALATLFTLAFCWLWTSLPTCR